MRARATVVIVVTLWTAPLADGQDSVSRTPDRIGRLQQWLDAVEQHELGTADDPLMRVASWDRNTLWLVWQDVGAIVSLVREPDILVFYTPTEPEPVSGIFHVPQPRLRTRVIPYGRDGIKRLQLIARQVKDRGGEDRILKRGATLHQTPVLAWRPLRGDKGGSSPPIHMSPRQLPFPAWGPHKTHPTRPPSSAHNAGDSRCC